jgi:hypothetical protein
MLVHKKMLTQNTIMSRFIITIHFTFIKAKYSEMREKYPGSIHLQRQGGTKLIIT